MTRRQWRSTYLVILTFTVGFMVSGCVAIVTIGQHNTMETQDNDGATSLSPAKGLLRR